MQIAVLELRVGNRLEQMCPLDGFGRRPGRLQRGTELAARDLNLDQLRAVRRRLRGRSARRPTSPRHTRSRGPPAASRAPRRRLAAALRQLSLRQPLSRRCERASSARKRPDLLSPALGSEPIIGRRRRPGNRPACRGRRSRRATHQEYKEAENDHSGCRRRCERSPVGLFAVGTARTPCFREGPGIRISQSARWYEAIRSSRGPDRDRFPKAKRLWAKKLASHATAAASSAFPA